LGLKNIVELQVNYNGQTDKVGFVVDNIYNGGYAGQDQVHVREHIEELAKLGVPAPTTTPTLYPIANYNLTTSDTIQVQNKETSGEIEYVILWQAGEVYVTVGSDHSDRDLESFSVPKCKQACPDVIASNVWRYNDVKDHWGQLQLKCWVTKDGQRSLYQDATVGALMTLEEWTPIFKKLGLTNMNNCAFFSGTINTIGKQLIFADFYEIEMIDPVLKRTIRHAYHVTLLPEGIK
jgi:hypothetical protein